MISPDTGVKFENVAGIDEAKEELIDQYLYYSLHLFTAFHES